MGDIAVASPEESRPGKLEFHEHHPFEGVSWWLDASGFYKVVFYPLCQMYCAYFKPFGYQNFGEACERNWRGSVSYQVLEEAMDACQRHVDMFGLNAHLYQRLEVTLRGTKETA